MSGPLEWRYYSNPFWTDAFDPSLDDDASKAGALRRQAEAARPDVARDRALGWTGWAVAGILLPIIIWSAPGGDGYANGQGRQYVLLGFFFLFAAPVIAIIAGGAKSRALQAVNNQREAHLQRTFQHSWDRYQAWLEHLAATDGQMYAQVVAWQQANATLDQLARLESIQQTNARLTGLLAIIGANHLYQHRNQ
jgi:hypothetical protein